MSPSEFPTGISAVAAGQFGGGQSFFAERQHSIAKRDESASQQDLSQHTETEDDEQEAQANEPVQSEPEPVFEPTYDLSKSVEHHAHVGLLLDVKL